MRIRKRAVDIRSDDDPLIGFEPLRLIKQIERRHPFLMAVLATVGDLCELLP